MLLACDAWSVQTAMPAAPICSSSCVRRAIAACKQKGAKRALELPVSVPAHSSLMRPAAEKLGQRLASVEIRRPRVAEIYTVDVRKHGEPDDIRQALVKQLFSPVRWADTVRQMVADGVTHFAECGPGKVLTGLNRRIERRKEIAMFALEESAAIDEAIATCRGTTHA